MKTCSLATYGRIHVTKGHLTSTAQQVPADLRPVRGADFEAARKEVAPSMPADSFAMEDLKQWARLYGEGSERLRGRDNPSLSYFT